MFNEFDIPCQRESEFVNHFVAAFKSGNGGLCGAFEDESDL